MWVNEMYLGHIHRSLHPFHRMNSSLDGHKNANHLVDEPHVRMHNKHNSPGSPARADTLFTSHQLRDAARQQDILDLLTHSKMRT